MGELVLYIFSAILTWLIFKGLYKWCEKNDWLGGPHFLDL